MEQRFGSDLEQQLFEASYRGNLELLPGNGNALEEELEAIFGNKEPDVEASHLLAGFERRGFFFGRAWTLFTDGTVARIVQRRRCSLNLQLCPYCSMILLEIH